MAQNLPYKSVRPVGQEGISRRAVSFTPDDDIILRHWSIMGKRLYNWDYDYTKGYWVLAGSRIDRIEWEIRVKDSGGHYPDTQYIEPEASGSIGWTYHSYWKLNRVIKNAFHLADPITLTAGQEYYFIIKTPEDTGEALLPFGWVDTYENGDASEVDSSVYSCHYDAATDSWSIGDNSYNLTLYILDEQAGDKWHVVIDGEGYMQPDNMRGYSAEQAQSGLAQSRGGQSEYSQLRYPYSNLSQDNWVGGMGQLNMEDMSSYLHGVSVDTLIRDQAFLGPKVYRTGLDSDNPIYDSDNVVAKDLPDNDVYAYGDGTATYMAQKFTPASNITANTLQIRIQKQAWAMRYSPSLAIFSDSASSPGSNLTGWQEFDTLYKPYWQGVSINQALTGGTPYWIVVRTDQSWGSMPEHRVLFDNSASAPGGAARWSRDGVSWSSYPDSSMLFAINGGVREFDGDVYDIEYGEVNGVGGLYTSAGDEVYKWDETNQYWEQVGTKHFTENVDDIVCYNGNLFAAQGYDNNVFYWDGASWNDAGYAAKHLYVGKGFYWASTSESKVKRSNDGTSAVSMEPAAGIDVGESVFEITNIIMYQGYLLVFKENGIWEIDDQDLALNYLDYTSAAAFDNGKAAAVWSGMLFFNVQSEIWRWQGSQYKAIGPTNNKAGPGTHWPVRIRALTAMPDKLLAAGESREGHYNGLMAYNGLGWHTPAIGSDKNADCEAVYVNADVGTDEVRIWFGMENRMNYVRYPDYTPDRYEWSDADFDVTNGSLITSWWDGGLKDALKFWNRVTLIADIPDNTSIGVFCVKDGEEWHNSEDMYMLGELTNDQLEDTGEYTVMFPDGMVAKTIQLLFMLKSNDSTKSPRLKAYNIESMVRQQPVYVYQFRVLLANNVTNMAGETVSRSADDMWTDLQEAAATNEPIYVSFPGKTIRGVISHLGEQTLRYAADGAGNQTWERGATVSVLEAL